MSHFRYLLEYAGLRVGFWGVRRLPFPRAQALACRLADMWYFLDYRRRHTARSNIERAGIVRDPEAVSRIARESFRHFALTVVESATADAYFVEDGAPKDCYQENIHSETRSLLAQPGQGVILVSGHLGNWELAARIISKRKPVVGVTKRLSNPYADRFVWARKAQGRFQLTPMRGEDPSRFLAVLRAGSILALLVDQYARGRKVYTDFFGYPAATHPSPALLHLVTQAPLCFGYCVRAAPMRFQLCAGPPLRFHATGNRMNDVQTILRALNGLLEEAIRQYPEQYLWGHRRWREKVEPV